MIKKMKKSDRDKLHSILQLENYRMLDFWELSPYRIEDFIGKSDQHKSIYLATGMTWMYMSGVKKRHVANFFEKHHATVHYNIRKTLGVLTATPGTQREHREFLNALIKKAKENIHITPDTYINQAISLTILENSIHGL